MEQTIYNTLFTAAQSAGLTERTPEESDQEHLQRLVEAVNNITEEAWRELPQSCQTWQIRAVKSINAMNVAPECPGFVYTSKPNAEPAPAKTTLRFDSSKPNKANTPKAAKPISVPKVVDKKKRSTGISAELRKLVILHPDWSARDLYNYLKDNGFPNAKLETIAVDGGNIRRTIELAREMGFWNEKNYEATKEPEVANAKA